MVSVHKLKTLRDDGILDPDDFIQDVVEDKELVNNTSDLKYTENPCQRISFGLRSKSKCIQILALLEKYKFDKKKNFLEYNKKSAFFLIFTNEKNWSLKCYANRFHNAKNCHFFRFLWIISSYFY